jgi:hypothetical protein
MILRLEAIKRTDTRLTVLMPIHYSQPKGFVGRNICYAIYFSNKCYGAIVGGSATRFLPGRNEYFLKQGYDNFELTNIVNNLFYHIEPNGKYPVRNFTVKVLAEFRKCVERDWKLRYNDDICGFESLIELPRTGEVYRRDGWKEVGVTIGYSCKREGGIGTDNYTGKRVWNTTVLKPKKVFCREV